MKRVFLLLALLLIISPLILAAEAIDTTPTTTTGTQVGVPTDGQNTNPITERAQEILQKPREIEISSGLKSFYTKVFDLQSSDELNMTQLILLSLLFIFFTLIFSVIISMTSIRGVLSWITSLVFTILFAYLGGIRYVTTLIAGTNLGDIGVFTLILWAAGLFLVFFILNKVFRKIKQSSRLNTAQEEGRQVGTELAKLKAISDVDEAA